MMPPCAKSAPEAVTKSLRCDCSKSECKTLACKAEKTKGHTQITALVSTRTVKIPTMKLRMPAKKRMTVKMTVKL